MAGAIDAYFLVVEPLFQVEDIKIFLILSLFNWTLQYLSLSKKAIYFKTIISQFIISCANNDY